MFTVSGAVTDSIKLMLMLSYVPIAGKAPDLVM